MLQDPSSKKIPSIVGKFARVVTKVVNGTSGKISFEYAANDLKIRTMCAADHQSVACYFVGRGTYFYTFNPKSGQMAKFILRGFPPSTKCEEILAE